VKLRAGHRLAWPLAGRAHGGAAGTGTVLVTKGKEVEFEPETKLKFTLDKSAGLPKIAAKSF